jgi:ABC-type transporter Mla MlaB component
MDTQNDGAIALRGEQTVRTVATAAESLRAALAAAASASRNPIVLDCSRVSEVDVSFIQLILAARATARAQGRDLRLHAPAQGALLACLTNGGFLFGDTRVARDRRDFWLTSANQ